VRLATVARERAVCVSFGAFDREHDRLSYRFTIDEAAFSISIRYENVDFFELERRFGIGFMRRLYFHIGAFNANQYLSLAPARINFGEFAEYADAAFEALWQTIFLRVWGQWRYQNDLPWYEGPAFGLAASAGGPIAYPRARTALLFSGGGKDSVVGQAALAASGQRYDSLSYSHSVYGAAWHQHALIDKVLDFGTQGERNRISVFDDFLDSPILSREDSTVATLCAAETPASVFMSLPLALAAGYDDFVVAHERSADFGNFTWDVTGEEINHQWGKTLAAERLLSSYISTRLLEGFRYYSLLKPFSDVAIFSLAAAEPEALRYAHSCNTLKPWCQRCAKCIYIWLSYRAYLPPAFVANIFPEGLLDRPENRRWFHELLGLGAHRVFDCVGLPEEVRLAFELCRRAGVRGAAMTDFEAAALDEPYPELLARCLTLDDSRAFNIPAPVWRAVRPWAAQRLNSALSRLNEQLLVAT